MARPSTHYFNLFTAGNMACYAAKAAGPASVQGGTAVLATSILYSTAAGFSYTDTFSVTLADALEATVNGTVTVTVGAAPGTVEYTDENPQSGSAFRRLARP